MLRLRLATLPLLVLPGYMILSSLQACSSTSSTPTDGGADVDHPTNGCAEGDTLKVVDGHSLCCVAAASGQNDYKCHTQGGASEGGACDTPGATSPGDAYTITLDVCVKEKCSGDRSCEEFPSLAEEKTGTLVCTASGATSTWQWKDAGSTHRVERACLVTSTETCGGGIYDDATYAYSERSYAPDYAYACGYSGGTVVHHRELLVMSSTCATDGAPSPCPVGSL